MPSGANVEVEAAPRIIRYIFRIEEGVTMSDRITEPQNPTEQAAGSEQTVPLSFAGAASFADAESREILNLLGEGDSAGACCGGSCCAA